MVARLLLRAELRRGLRAHLAVVAMLAGVAAALTLAAVIGRMAQAPWERTWRASGSPHLTLFGHERAALEELRVDGKTASSGVLDTGFVGVHAGRYHVETRLAGDAAGRASGGPRSSRATPTACCSSAASPAGSASGRATP